MLGGYFKRTRVTEERRSEFASVADCVTARAQKKETMAPINIRGESMMICVNGGCSLAGFIKQAVLQVEFTFSNKEGAEQAQGGSLDHL